MLLLGNFREFPNIKTLYLLVCIIILTATGDAATAALKKKPTPRKTPESVAKQRKQLEKDLATHKKTLEQTKKKIAATKKKLEIIKKKEIQQKKMLAQKKQKTQTKKSPQKQQKAMMVKKRIVKEQFYF